MAVWARSKLDMRRSKFEKNTMYVQATIKKRKRAKSLLETGAGADDHDFKEKDVVDDTEPGASSTTNEEKRIAMCKFVK